MASPNWPAGFTPDQAQQLLDGGKITPDTFGRIVGNGASNAGISLPPPPPSTPPPATDPFALGANNAGIAAPTPQSPPPPTAPPSSVPNPSTQPLVPINTGTDTSQYLRVNRPAPPKAPGPKVEGGITLGGINPDTGEGTPSRNAPPPPQSASKRVAADNKKDQQKIDRADVDYIETGSNAPRMPRGHAPSKQEQQENALGRPLTDKEKNDPELLKRVLNAHQEGSEVRDAQDRQREAIQKGADIGSAKAAEENAIHTDQVALREKQAADFEKGEHDRQAAIASRQQALTDEADRISKTKIQAKDLYGNMSTGNKILSGIFTFFGAAQATRGGQASLGNAYTNRIDQDIRDDLELQKANLQNKKDMLGAKRGLLGDFINMTKDAREGELMAHAKYLEIAKDKLLGVASKYKGDEVQNQAQAAAADLDEKIANANQQRNDLIKQRLNAERASAAAAAAARAKEERDRRWELAHDASKDDALDKRQSQKEAYDAVKEAQKDGIAAPEWATKALGISPGQTPPASTSAGMTKEQKGAIAKEDYENQRGNDTFNKQMADISANPVIDRLGLGLAAKNSVGGQRGAPEAAKDVQELHALNEVMLMGIGKVAKDADGKPNVAKLNQLKEEFEIKPTDTPNMARAKIAGCTKAVNALAAQQGVKIGAGSSTTDNGKAANDNADPYAQYKVK